MTRIMIMMSHVTKMMNVGTTTLDISWKSATNINPKTLSINDRDDDDGFDAHDGENNDKKKVMTVTQWY